MRESSPSRNEQKEDGPLLSINPGLQTRPSTIKSEAISLTRLSLPNVISYLLGSFHQLITLVFVGQYMSIDDLGGVALGFSTVTLTGCAFITGLLSAMDTLCSQAHGANYWKLYASSTLRAMLVCSVFALCIIIPLWTHSYSILTHLNQPHELSWRASRVCLLFMLNLPAYIGIEILRRFLVCQNISRPLLYFSISSYLFFHPLLLFTVFTVFEQRNFLLAPLCFIISCYVYLLQLLLFTKCSRRVNPNSFAWPKTFAAWSEVLAWNGTDEHRDSYDFMSDVEVRNEDNEIAMVAPLSVRDGGLKEYICLAFAGVCSFCGEWVALEILTIFAGVLGDYSLAAHVIMQQIENFIFMVPLGIAIATASRVGQLIGQKQITLARKLSYFSLVFTICVACSIVLLLLTIHYCVISLPNMFTMDENVAIIADKLLYLFVWMILNDAVQVVLQSILRAMKQQTKAALACLISLYCVGLPLAVFLGFSFGADLGVVGFWLAQNVGYFIFCCILFIIFETNKIWTI